MKDETIKAAKLLLKCLEDEEGAAIINIINDGDIEVLSKNGERLSAGNLNELLEDEGKQHPPVDIQVGKMYLAWYTSATEKSEVDLYYFMPMKAPGEEYCEGLLFTGDIETRLYTFRRVKDVCVSDIQEIPESSWRTEYEDFLLWEKFTHPRNASQFSGGWAYVWHSEKMMTHPFAGSRGGLVASYSKSKRPFSRGVALAKKRYADWFGVDAPGQPVCEREGCNNLALSADYDPCCSAKCWSTVFERDEIKDVVPIVRELLGYAREHGMMDNQLASLTGILLSYRQAERLLQILDNRLQAV